MDSTHPFRFPSHPPSFALSNPTLQSRAIAQTVVLPNFNNPPCTPVNTTSVTSQNYNRGQKSHNTITYNITIHPSTQKSNLYISIERIQNNNSTNFPFQKRREEGREGGGAFRGGQEVIRYHNLSTHDQLSGGKKKHLSLPSAIHLYEILPSLPPPFTFPLTSTTAPKKTKAQKTTIKFLYLHLPLTTHHIPQFLA